MRFGLSLLPVLLLAACQPAPASAPEAAPVAAEAAATAPESAELPQDAAPPAVATLSTEPPPPCSTGRTLAVTEVCSDANPALFRAVGRNDTLQSPKCVWYTEQLQLSDDEFLVFRNQDCSAEGWDGAIYGYGGGKVRQGAATTPHAIDRVILEIFPLAEGQSAQDRARLTLDTAPEAERARCIIRPLEDASIAGTTFELAPDDAYMAELAQRQEPWEACGDQGSGRQITLWEARAGRALYHLLGHDVGAWDPASFTFYRRNAEGAWRKLID